MDKEIKEAKNAIDNDSLTKTEKDFIDILPDEYQEGALAAYKDYRRVSVFGSVFERSKMASAWMSGFVTAVYFVQREDRKQSEVTPEIPNA